MVPRGPPDTTIRASPCSNIKLSCQRLCLLSLNQVTCVLPSSLIVGLISLITTFVAPWHLADVEQVMLGSLVGRRQVGGRC